MNSPDKTGWTPLKLASNHRNRDVTMRLEHLGALLRADCTAPSGSPS
jgi:hypothetical protein